MAKKEATKLKDLDIFARKKRTMHPNSLANLVDLSNRTPEERREIIRKGRDKAAAGRRKHREMRELLIEALRILAEDPETGEKMPKEVIAMAQLANKMALGDLKAIRLGVQILGEFEQKLQVESTGPMQIVVGSKTTADNIAEILNE